MLDEKTVVTTTAGPGGDATVAVNLLANLRKTQADVHVFADSCGNLRRVFLIEAGRQPADAEGACARQTVPDLFVLQPVTTLLVDLAGGSLAIWIRQGPVPPGWLGGEGPGGEKRVWRPVPSGLVLSAGGGAARFSDAVSNACGDVTQCSGQQTRGAVAADVTYWFNRFIGVDAGYMRPALVHTSGSGDTFTFDNQLDARVLTVSGKAGGQVGPVRLYGIGGVAYISAVSTTTQTVTATAATPGTPASTEVFAIKTGGWGYIAGLGAEHWVLPWLGVYAEGGRVALKGSAVDNGQGTLDDQLTFAIFGARVHIGR